MTAPTDPTPPRGWRRRLPRPRGRTAVIAASVLALLVVGGVAAALVIPGGGPHRGADRADRPGIGLANGEGRPDRGGDPGLGGDLGLSGGDLAGLDGGRGRGGRGLGDDALLAGTVVSTTGDALTLTPDGAAQRTLRTDGSTRVRGATVSGLGDLQPGQRVVVRVSGTGDAATAVSVLVPRARVTGTVTALSGDTATVTAVDGLVVTADVAALAQEPAVGDLVVLTGTAEGGTTLRADGIRVLPKAS